MSVISAGTTLTTALVQTGDTNGNLVFRTGASGTTALTLGSDQSATFAGAVSFGTSAFAAGSAASPSITFTGDTNTGIFSPAADTIAFTEGGVEVARFDSSGNLGIGTSSPSQLLSLRSSSVAYSDFAGGNRTLGTNSFTVGQAADGVGLLFLRENTHMFFATNSTERMRIDQSGNVGIGTSSFAIANRLNVKQSADNSAAGLGLRIERNSNDSSLLVGYRDNTDTWQINATYGTTGAFKPISFHTADAERMRIDSSGNLLVGVTSNTSGYSGVIQCNGPVAATGYVTRAGVSAASYGGNRFNIFWTGSQAQLWVDGSNVGTISLTSDYRIKRNIQTQTTPALERVMALRPVTYQMADYKDGLFKASDDIKEGFIAHEVQEVIPSGAEGVKDDENQIQSLRVDAILAVAVKAIQEQQAIIQSQADTIAAMDARLTVLENK